jgi:outer membrane protein, heavy metal efflux system
VAWVAVGLLLGHAPAVAGELTRADVVRLALSAHPAAEASSLRADAARSAVNGEGGYAPLMLEGGIAPATLPLGRPGVQASAGWTLPLWGMRGLARSAAGSRADMAEAGVRMTRAELAAGASIAVDDWLVAVERLDVLGHHQATMVAVREVISRRVAAGLAPPGAEAMARMAVLDLEEQRLVAQRDLAWAEAALQALAGVRASELSVDIPPLEADAPAAEGSSPAVQMATAELAMRSDMAEMARREGRPMISPMVALNNMWADPMDWAMVGVEVGVPVDGGALRARREAAALERGVAEASVEAVHRDVTEERARAVAMLRMAEAMEALMRTEGEPLAVERARLARSAWEGDQAPVGEWLDAERAVLEARWRIAEARAERSRAIAMIAMLDGQPIGLPPETP